MNTLSNEFITISAKPEGAELCSIQTLEEHLWQADPAVWSRHAPVLFPIVGKLKNNQYTHHGKIYTLSQHGFARDSLFTVLEQIDNTLTYQLLPTEKTHEAYPFDFELRVIYHLDNNCVTVKYEVSNHGAEPMPFSIGAHPGFNLPGTIEECSLTLEKEETLTPRLLDADGLLSSETVSLIDQSDSIQLTKTLFDRDALIFLDVDFKKLTIASKSSDIKVSVDFSEFPHLGIWSKPAAPFICIEPWFGHADPQEPYGEISNKPGIQILPPGKTFQCQHRISVKLFND